MMDLSLIVCTYNRSQSLAKTLESIARQVIHRSIRWEIVVVDNNSTDRTREVVHDFSRKWPGRFRHVLEERQGLSFARNTGIRESQGDVLAFTDDDVTMEPDWLWHLTSNLHSREWAGSGGRIIPVWAKPLPSWLSTDDLHTLGPFVAFDAGTEGGALNRPPYGANMAFRREAFQKYGGFRTDLGRSGTNLFGREDIEFGNRLLAAGEHLRYEPLAVVFHPASESRMTQSFVLRWWFWFGYGEVIQLGPPYSTRWSLKGVPLYLTRRLVRWTLQWIATLNSPARFACRRNVWYLAGIIRACCELPRRQATQPVSGNDLLSEKSEPPPLQANEPH
jgi:glycosyltransferase involved in cell wall biosynthesis